MEGNKFFLKISISAFCLSAILLIGSLLPQPPVYWNVSFEGWRQYRLVAHALGGIDNKVYTNSIEAFEQNYATGFRVFEFDMRLIQNDELVGIHTIEDWQYMTGESHTSTEQIPLDLFKTVKIYDSYNPLTFNDWAEIMVKHPDIYLVTDTKYTDKNHVQKQFNIIKTVANEKNSEILNRIVPQIYNESMYTWIEEICEFDEYIYTLYQTNASFSSVINFVAHTEKITAVTIDRKRIKNYRFAKSLHQYGVVVYAHTVNTNKEIHRLTKMGVYGIYTDFAVSI